ncbi:hypothetical protein CLV24_14210 [Pontibacter ummariensis]|uniref:Uncharacterized protein n=1 Tax=Pontibacter ummariensis TaxID=1610492 RepID=A0A239LJI0_9BACT|nr:hypothetical protein [Pontibacter ummariensis]PRY03355.1 hypothetical protein CLV24_14210 [Pontibacter ummariensis]SNT29829.1 hypothetical protein SAMN06296052_14210 [Pontibacter ummariensis]
MNYITHLTSFFQRVSRDYRLNPTHVSLYMALFQQWNLIRFRNPISVCRSELMQVSRISSRVTYHKCIKELHAWGYVHYDPSYNHFRGSLVYMLGFEEKQDREGTLEQAVFCTGAVQVVDSGCMGTEREVGPSINSINKINLTNSRNGRERARDEGSEYEQVGVQKERRKEKGCAEKEKKAAVEPPGLEEVRTFFLERGYRELEAFRFFHHYSANGWMLGRSPMQDWKAGARKWMLNELNQNRGEDASDQGNHRPAPAAGGAGAKDYTEPL